jgi:hypothetical protein
MRTQELGMEYGRAIVVDGLESVELGRTQPVIYDREIGLRLLYQDRDSGGSTISSGTRLVSGPACIGTQPPTPSWFSTAASRSTTSHRPEGVLSVPAREAMRHAPAVNAACLFVTLFDGPFDVQPIDE